MVAYQSSRGPVSEFIQRYLNDYVGNNWGQLKTELTSACICFTAKNLAKTRGKCPTLRREIAFLGRRGIHRSKWWGGSH